MLYKSYFRSVATAIVFVLVITLAATMSAVSAAGDDDPVIPLEKAELKYPNLGSALDQLVASVEEGQAIAQDAAEGASIFQGESVAVTIYLSGNVEEVVTFLENNGGDPRNVGEDYIEAYVPVTLLGPVSERPGVLRVQEIVPPQPTQLSQRVIGDGPAVHGSQAWNAAGFSGQGVKVGIIDDFKGLSSLMGTEVPSTVVARCYTDIGVFTQNLADCEQVPPVSVPFPECLDAAQRRALSSAEHGTIVAESLLDIAPGVSLYIANPSSQGDMQEAVEWMASQGVSVINFSAGWTFDGPGDGTSPSSVSPLNTVDQAVENDILWINAAGNNAQDTWFGGYSNPDGNNAIGFGGLNDEVIDMPLRACERYVVQLRWEDDWSGARTDLDLYLYDKSTNEVVFASGYLQSGEAGHVPFEAFQFRVRIDNNDLGIAVGHHSGEAPDWIQVMAWTIDPIQHHTLNGSITNPAESANPGMLAVGAAPWYDVRSIEPYSSRGPTPDGRAKPEIVGADCGETALVPLRVGNRGFCGTSQAAAHVAGMAALVQQRFPDYTPQQVATYLKHRAEQREASLNNTWGYGFAQLPADDATAPTVPLFISGPTDQCDAAISSNGFIIGEWAAACQSRVSGRGYAKYYTFSLAEESEVTIDLESSVDTYLYLRRGEARLGTVLHENDDVEVWVDLDSRISETLTAGTYTIEATTFASGAAGTFTLTIAGLGVGGTVEPGPDPDPDPEATDSCGAAISSGGAVTGEWAAACQSRVSGRGYAKYYTFSLAEESEVTIDLESSVDTYLYLRRGEARLGTVLHENDDVEVWVDLDSRISETLTAGTYTIEATTFASGAAGTFTLTIAGLGVGGTVEPGPDPDPDPEATDSCGAAISSGGAVTGEWAAACQSRVSGRGYAKYYTFSLAEESEVTIDLESSVDTYLYLRRGEARLGTVLHENDDVEVWVDLDSRISETLTAGTYTIEATTFASGAAGTFTLTIAGLGAGSM